jgi:hypothetical protein
VSFFLLPKKWRRNFCSQVTQLFFCRVMFGNCWTCGVFFFLLSPRKKKKRKKFDFFQDGYTAAFFHQKLKNLQNAKNKTFVFKYTVSC